MLAGGRHRGGQQFLANLIGSVPRGARSRVTRSRRVGSPKAARLDVRGAGAWKPAPVSDRGGYELGAVVASGDVRP